MYCTKCGTPNEDDRSQCVSCGASLRDEPAKVTVQPVDGTLGGLIPYRNGLALTGYYLGVFSLVCGLLLGVPALILGILGLRFANRHPQAKGKAHAWTAIILGTITTLASIVGLFLLFAAIARNRP